ncbi:arylesterase [Thiomicrorhabdus xiamenensis]|uniref:Arylesterase n=1 Tax=Thiomicrorhabdus xiamenensis TaxID=2739063 RepID=A0A7D4T0K3_9GAMM|nr:arylesterase [Thiomicrorhabdus xiamenensis]QKI88825.1 arylesterase [Thiomicrorhabdus xiamenensis]
MTNNSNKLPVKAKRFYYLLFCLWLGFHPNLLWAQQQAPIVGEVKLISPPATILVLGDSLSAAYGIDAESGWVNLLRRRLQTSFPDKALSVVNASISGETTSGGLQRLPKLLQEHRPSLLILELGANDALRGQNLLQSKANLERMIHLCDAAPSGCQTMLLGIRLPTNYGPAYERLLMKVYRDLAQQYKLNFDPFFLQGVALDPDLMQDDALHPNEQGQSPILERLWPLVERYFSTTS